MSELGDDEFVGYHFVGAPELRPRLWFLERELHLLGLFGSYSVGPRDWFLQREMLGTWTINQDELRAQLGPNGKAGHLIGEDLEGLLKQAMPGLAIRWEDTRTGVAAVWRLTTTRISYVHTFGRDDDVWRLGLWPD